jgi:ankyrin repeat protein
VLIYLLSQKGINVNIVGEYGRTIFDWACTYINKLPIEIFKLLIETKGCDVNVRDKYNNTPLYDALRYFNPSQGGDIKTLTYLLNQKGVNGNIVGEYGCTLLHYACKRINELPIEIFKLLIETMGCDVNAENKNKDTPLHNALLCFDPSHGGNITVLTYLLNQNYVNLNIKNERGCTLLHVACNNIRDLSFDIFKVLIETMGCDVNAQDNDKDTPLHYALRYFNPNHDDHLVPVLQYLFSQKNADVNIKGKNGHTILHLASICEIGYDDEDDHEDDHDNDDDDEDDDDSDEGLDDSVIEDIQNQKADTTLCQIVEAIAERCIREVFDEEIPLEATTTM